MPFLSITMKEKLNIRKLKETDVVAVSRLCRRCINEINSQDITPQQTKFLYDHFSSKCIRASSKETAVYVAVLNRKIVGTVTIMRNQIKAVFVNPNFHGFGIGAKLISHIEKILKKNRRSSVFLNSSKHAVGFYKKLGYVKIKNISAPFKGIYYIFPGSTSETSFIMEIKGAFD